MLNQRGNVGMVLGLVLMAIVFMVITSNNNSRLTSVQKHGLAAQEQDLGKSLEAVTMALSNSKDFLFSESDSNSLITATIKEVKVNNLSSIINHSKPNEYYLMDSFSGDTFLLSGKSPYVNDSFEQISSVVHSGILISITPTPNSILSGNIVNGQRDVSINYSKNKSNKFESINIVSNPIPFTRTPIFKPGLNTRVNVSEEEISNISSLTMMYPTLEEVETFESIFSIN